MARKSEIGNRKSSSPIPCRESLKEIGFRLPIPGSRLRERGYTMVAIVIGMAILAILIMGVAPSVATIMKREREKELLFRGKQYARAIALFQRRYGRFPNELKELYENRPRTIRKLFDEPICRCPDWHVIYQNSPDALPGGGIGGPPGMPPGGRPLPTPTPGVFGPSGQPKSVGPIIGVRSSVHEEALTEWRGQKFYDEWRFIMGDADKDIIIGLPGGSRPPGAPPFATTPPVIR
jgi:type II secretory pathway pseudopilin PulG